MYYPIAIEPGNETTAWGVTVPDIPGCFSAGDTLDEAMANAREAIEGHLGVLADDNEEIPTASTVQELCGHEDYTGMIWAVVPIDVARFEGKAEKINITLPKRLLSKIDDFVRSHGGNRSGFLADAARAAMKHA